MPSLLQPFTLNFLVDKIALWFVASVTLIRGAVFRYSLIYMAHEPAFIRFHTLVFIFIGSILLLTLSTDIITLLIGWDGLGVSSFLLVVFFQRNNSWNAGVLTLLSNRVGDVLLLIGAAVARAGMTRDLEFISTTIFRRSSSRIFWEPILVMCGVLAALTKSALFPFSAWLPAAIAAPTPVSALVHSSTLVTAGVYVLIRLRGSLQTYVPRLVLRFRVFASLATILLAGFAALFEHDLKKIVALSTLRQLGFMAHLALAELPVIAFYHLLTHAFFKSLLFMAVGSVIHSVGGGQDLRRAQIQPSTLPVTTALMLLTNLRLIGLPFLRGHYSKDAFLEIVSVTWGHWPSSGLWLTLITGVCLTCVYTSRFLFLLLCNELKSSPLAWERERDLALIRPCWGQAFLRLEVGLFLSCFWLPNLRRYPSLFEKHFLISVLVCVFLIRGPLTLWIGRGPRRALFWVGGLRGLNIGVKSLKLNTAGQDQLQRIEVTERYIWGYLTYGATYQALNHPQGLNLYNFYLKGAYIFGGAGMWLLLSLFYNLS